MQDEKAALEKLNKRSLGEAIQEMDEAYSGVEWSGISDDKEEYGPGETKETPF